MHPNEITVVLGSAEQKELLADLTSENRALRLVLAQYIARYGVLTELGGPAPEPPVPADDAVAPDPIVLPPTKRRRAR